MASVITKKALKYVSGRWGKEDEDPELNLAQTEDFFVAMMRKDDWILDDQTWNDLDMNRVYKKVNRTFSIAGQQCLYNMMRILRFDEAELKRRDRVIQFFQHNKEDREQIQHAEAAADVTGTCPLGGLQAEFAKFMRFLFKSKPLLL